MENERQILSLTDKAATYIKSLMEQDKEVKALRIAVIGGGCNGLQYKMSFEKTIPENIIRLQDHGVDIIVDKKSFLFLKGTEIDYTDGLDGQGFTFGNPNAKSKCGCGTSFGA